MHYIRIVSPLPCCLGYLRLGKDVRTIPILVMALLSRFSLLAVTVLLSRVGAQPSPIVQENIYAAIARAAVDPSNIDYTEFVNVFIGTDNYGDVWYVLLLAS